MSPREDLLFLQQRNIMRADGHARVFITVCLQRQSMDKAVLVALDIVRVMEGWRVLENPKVYNHMLFMGFCIST